MKITHWSIDKVSSLLSGLRYPTEGNDPNNQEPMTAALPTSSEPDPAVALDDLPPEQTPEPGEQIMVAWMMDDDTSQRLALDHEGAATAHHVTLAYIGRMGTDLDRAGLVRLMATVEALSRTQAPLEGQLAGVGRFVASESSEGRDVMWAAVDCPGLDVVRGELVRALDAAQIPYSQEHGFTPHVTLAYVRPDEDIQIERAAYDHQPVRFDRMSVVVADKERMDFPLGGQLAIEEPMETLDSDGTEVSPEAILVDEIDAQPDGSLAPTTRDFMKDARGRIVPSFLPDRWAALDKNPAALKGTKLRTSFPSRIRKITPQETDALTRFLRDLGVESAGKGRQVPWLISTNERARDGHTIAINGWLHANYDRNPVVLWQHDRDEPPIGRSMVSIAPDGLRALAEFTPRDLNPFGGMIGDMVADGFLHSPSVGWDTIAATRVRDPALIERYGYPLDISEAELLEWSVVTIPADTGTGVLAARAAGIDVSPMAAWASRKLDGARGGDRVLLEHLWRIARGSGRLIFDGGKRRPNPEDSMPVRNSPKQPTRGLRCPSCGGAVRATDGQRDPNAEDPTDPNHPNMSPKNPTNQGNATPPRTSRGPVDLSKLPPGVAQAIEALLSSLTQEETQEGQPPPGQTQGAPPPPPGAQQPPPGGKPVDNSGNPPQNVPDDIKKAREELGLPTA